MQNPHDEQSHTSKDQEQFTGGEELPMDENQNQEAGAEGATMPEHLQAEYSQLKDKYLRLMAEFDNFRKRTARQRNEERATAAIDTVRDLLPVLDDFNRAKSESDNPDTPETFSPGIEMVYEKFKRTLSNLGLKQMESTGQPFDADKFEAVTEIPAPDPSMSGKVIDTIEAGYLLNDRIIRHAKVVVGK